MSVYSFQIDEFNDGVYLTSIGPVPGSGFMGQRKFDKETLSSALKEHANFNDGAVTRLFEKASMVHESLTLELSDEDAVFFGWQVPTAA